MLLLIIIISDIPDVGVFAFEGDNDYSKYKEYKLHYKSDKADAIWIGRAIIELAKEQYEN